MRKLAMNEILSDLKKIDLDISNISVVNGVKPAKVSNNVLSGIKNFYNSTTAKNKNAYRERIKTLYDNLKDIKPENFKVNNVIYTKNYIEKGITISSNVNSLKQLWVEFRLIYNEFNAVKKIEVKPKEKTERKIENYMENKESYVLSNFDELFDKLNKKVDGTSKYVSELKNMKESVISASGVLENSKKLFEQEKANFEKYVALERQKLEKERQELEAIKKAQDLKIEKEKEKLDKNYKRLQKLTDKFNKQVSKLINK